MSGAATVAANRLDAAFCARSVHVVARELIGCRLFHEGCGGTIVETESYERDDPACHAYGGPTKRNAPLFGPPGRAYVYLSYGIHSLFNVVAEPEGEAAAVLIRALEPATDVDAMQARRGPRPEVDLCSGPGKLTEALGIGLDSDGADLSADPFLLLPRESNWRGEVVTSPRVGITKAVDLPWRFSLAGSPFVSRPNPRPPSRLYPAVMPPPPPPDSGDDGGGADSGAGSDPEEGGSGASTSGAEGEDGWDSGSGGV